MNCYSHASSLQAVFAVALGPFTFFNVQKTKYLQLFTTVTRWLGKMKKHTCYILSVTVLMPYIFKLLILQRNLATKIWYFKKNISDQWIMKIFITSKFNSPGICKNNILHTESDLLFYMYYLLFWCQTKFQSSYSKFWIKTQNNIFFLLQHLWSWLC